MRFLLLTLVSVCSLDSYSQDARDYVILLLIKQGVEESKLPTELVNVYDSVDYRHKVVVIQNTEENKLNSGAYTRFNDVDYTIWTAEELFTRDPYWMTPRQIKRKGSKMSFKFTTTYLATEKKTCYKGLIKGEILNGKWILTSCSYTPTICRYDLKKLAMESNAR
jgi:hypothetical protein